MKKKDIIKRLIEINDRSIKLFKDNIKVLNKLTINELRQLEISSEIALRATEVYLQQIKER